MNDSPPCVRWTDEEGEECVVRWRSLAGHPPPGRVLLVDDTLSADRALKLAREGVGLLWVGDFQNARHLLQTMGRRLETRAQKAGPRARPAAAPKTSRSVAGSVFSLRRDATPAAVDPARLKAAFFAQREVQARRARVLGMLLLPFDADHGVPLRRAPDVRAAGLEAHGPVDEHYVASLRELLGLIGAHEWRRKGVPIDALQARIHPHHGVFSPVRGEYVELVARAPLPPAAKQHGAFDVGTGTGVLAAVLARRGLKVVATDRDPRAIECAADNLGRLGLATKVTLQQADLFPSGRAGLAACNPPWLPIEPATPLEAAVYDAGSRMLRGFLDGLAGHLAGGGEGWLILSDLAEHLGLRSREELLGWIAGAGLVVAGRLDARPSHKRAADADDPLFAARSAEVTSLWRLRAADAAHTAPPRSTEA